MDGLLLFLSKLPEEKRRNQILLLIGFFIVLFIIVGLVNLLDINSKFTIFAKCKKMCYY